ncbi:MAG: hypothetical protein HY908_18565 [Myxococcales bacterium]|nr:hypothetical protein [Myxococcales bacterium]
MISMPLRTRIACLSVAVALGACTKNEVACTLIGCSSFVEASAGPLAATYAADLPITAELCLDGGVCRSFTVSAPVPPAATASCELVANGAPYDGTDCVVEPDGNVVLTVMLPPSGNYEGSHVVRLRVLDASATELTSLTRDVVITGATPNGPACDPVCYQTSVDFAP